MAVEAPLVAFRRQTVALFEQRTSDLRNATTKETMQEGLTATFLVSGSDGARMNTRGTTGDIAYGNPNNAQVTATLVEKHAGEELTGFNIFASQGNQKQIMMMNVVGKAAREIDYEILDALASATQDFGTGPATLQTLIGAKVILAVNQVPTSETDNMFAVVSPAFMGYMMQTTEFASADYVDVKPFAGPVRRMLRWGGLNIIESPLVTGVGTASEICYVFHRSAIGYAVNLGEEKIDAEYESKHDRSWARATLYHKAVLLQNTGIVKITHDGSAFVAT